MIPVCHPDRKHLARGLCSKCYQRQRYASNPEKARETAKRFYRENPDKFAQRKRTERVNKPDHVRAIARNRRAANPEKFRAEAKRKYRKNTDQIKAECKKWRKEHPEECRGYKQRRRALKRGTTVERITPAQLEARAAKFGGGCFYCSCRGTIGPLEHWDHGLPLSRGGSHTLDNLFPSCAACNLSKGAKTVIEFLSIVTR